MRHVAIAWTCIGLLFSLRADAQCEVIPTTTLHVGENRTITMNDDWLVVGRNHVAEVFHRSGAYWSATQTLGPIEGSSSFFGLLTSLSENNLALATQSTIDIFEFNGSAWIWSQRLDRNGTEEFTRIALDGQQLVASVSSDTLVVARMYEKTPTGWIETPPLLHPNEDGGSRVAIESDTVIVLIPEATWTYAYYGLAVEFSNSPSGWEFASPVAKPYRPFYASAGGPTSVALNDTWLALGHSGSWNVPAESFPGGVYLYRRLDDRWTFHSILKSREAPNFGQFGWSLAIKGNYLIVGAPDDGSAGTAYLFHYSPEGWKQVRKVRPSSSGDFGWIVAINNQSYAVGDRFNRISIFDLASDCDNNGRVDECEIKMLGVVDCNDNTIPDVCEPPADCNANSIQDICEIHAGHQSDCNFNSIIDACESSGDCDENTVFDICELDQRDCQANGFIDSCEIESSIAVDLNDDNIPDECQCEECTPPGSFPGPCFSLRAVAVNGQPIIATAAVAVQPGDIVTTEIFVSCWGDYMPEVSTYECRIQGVEGALSGENGQVIPLGWDAPIIGAPCPCDNPAYPICDQVLDTGCIGPNHHPELGSFIDVYREDFLLAGSPTFSAVNISSINSKFGGTADDGTVDQGQPRYLGTYVLVVSDDAQGVFSFDIDITPLRSLLIDPLNLLIAVGHSSGLTIHVQCDDGIYCNGIEYFDGSQCVAKPPPCDDGVGCTIDFCNESFRVCSHSLDHSACDDNDGDTIDLCTPSGCSYGAAIPTASTWGLLFMGIILLIGAKLSFRRETRKSTST